MHKKILEKKHCGDGKRWPLTPSPCAVPRPSRRPMPSPSLCWAPHFMTQERLMFSTRQIPTRASRISLPPRLAVGSHSALSLRLYLAACNISSSCRFVGLGPSVLQFVWIVSPLLNHGNSIFKSVCVFYLFLFCSCFLIEMNFKFTLKSLFAIWSLSSQRLHHYFYPSIVSWQY